MIVVCGEALFDVFPQQQTATGIELSARNGGSPFNLAIGLARLGAAPMFFGGLSRDVFGRRLEAALRTEGVNLEAAPRSAAPTPLVIVSLDDTGHPAYAFYGGNTAECAVQLPHLALVPEAVPAIHVGSYCMVTEPVASTLRALVERQHGRSVIVYDPNVRLTIEPRVQLWRNALQWMLVRSDIIKISEEDIAALYPSLSLDAFLEQALRSGVALTVITRGAQGVVAATRAAGRLELPAAPVQVVDTVGAGDTFQAALLAGLSRTGQLRRQALAQMDRDSLAGVLTFAGRAAAITCSRRGADLPKLAEVNAAL
jgi:fructokinase